MFFSKGKKEVAYVFFLFLFSKIFSYAALLIFANYFVPQEYGQASFVWSLFNMVLFFSCLGLPETLVAWILKRKNVRTVFTFLLLVNLGAFVGALIIGMQYHWTLPLVILLPFMLVDATARAVLKSQYRYHVSQLASNMFVMLLVVFAFVLKDLGKFGIVLAYGLAYFLPTIWLFFTVRKDIKEVMRPAPLDWKSIWEYVKKGSSTSLIAACFAFLTWIDASLLGSLSTFESVAKYSVAGALANVVAAVPMSLSHFTLSRSAEVHGEHKSLEVLQRTVRLSFFFSLLFGIVLNALSFMVTKIFFPQYVGIEIFIAILSSGLLWYAVYSLLASFLMGRLRQESAVVPIVAATVTNVALDIILIPLFGLYGITVATAVAHAVAFVLLTKRVHVRRKFAMLVTSPILIFAAFYLQWYGLLMLPVAVTVCFWLRLVKKSDIAIVMQVVKGVLRRA
ncbi:MAG: polysaccharide biosynthesis C-terminal domain-containing protein [Nanoarchaeota archaeon]|nr:polysaccharide biosynthesis C-terminal domain-containing protein [Nanoarchaeota archaeon]